MRPTSSTLRHLLPVLFSLLCLLAPLSVEAAFTGTTTWKGAASGTFGTGTNWTTDWTSSGSNYLLRISGTSGGASPVVVTANATIGGLDIASGFQLIRQAGTGVVALTISGSTGADTFFSNSGTITGGSGTLRFAISPGAGTIANSGVLEATAGNTLSFQSATGGSLTINNTGGLMRTVGTGDLSLASNQNGSVSVSGGTIQNAAGTIDQKNLSTYTNVALTNGGLYTISTAANASVAQGLVLAGTTSFNNSGTLSLATTGTIVGVNTVLSINSGSAALINSGVVTITSTGTVANTANASLLFAVSSTVSNSGVITLDSQSATGNTQLDVGGNTATLAGSGTLVMKVDTGGAVGRVIITGTSSGAGQLVNSSGHTIRGAGLLGNDTIGTITNNGLINADDASFALTVNPFSTTGSVVNSGTIRASGAGGLVLADGVYTNSGLIQVDAGSVLTTNVGAALTNSGSMLISGSWNGNGTVANNSNITYSSAVNSSVSGVISGTGTVTKSGAGSLTLAGNNSYTGTTSVTAGTLVINGSGASAVVVSSGAILGGSGTVGNSVTISNGGTLAPGNSPGVLSTGALSLTGTASTLAMEMSGTSAGAYDQVNVAGAVNLNGNGRLELTLLSGFSPVQGDLFFLIVNDSTDAINGTLFGLADQAFFSAAGKVWQISYFGNAEAPTPGFTGGNDLVLQVVPEPGTTVLVGVGLFSMLTLWRRRKS